MGGEHDHGTAAAAHKGQLTVVLCITVVILASEVVGGVLTHSLALLADAAHMLADVIGIGLALLAVVFAARPATLDRTFGYQRAEVLAAVVNAVFLFGVGAYILVEAVRRLLAPPEVHPGLMIVFGILALVGNGTSLLVLREGKGESINIRGAFLEVLSDVLGAAAVIISGLLILLLNFGRADAIASIFIGALIVPRTWKLLRSALNILFEATPQGLDMAAVRAHILEVPSVVDVHDLHAWTITSGVPVLSAHVVVEDRQLAEGHGGAILDRLQECLRGDFEVEHSTFQLEPVGHTDHEMGMHH